MSQQFHRKTESGNSPPLTARELQELAQAGTISPDEEILCIPPNSWIVARKIQGLQFRSAAPAESSQTTETAGSKTKLGRPRQSAVLVPVIAGLLLAAAGGYAWYQSNPAPAPVDPKAAVDQRQLELDKELREDRDKLRKEVEEIQKQRDALRKDVKTLEGERDDLKAQVDKLTTQIETLNRWKGIELVLFSTDNMAVGLKKAAGGFQVSQKVDGSMAGLVQAACRNLHIPRTSDDSQLARDVFVSVEEGEFLSPEFSVRLSKSIWKTHQFVRARPETSTSEIDLTVFRDRVTNQVRIGFLNEFSDKGIQVEAYGASRELISWNQIQSGSARHGTPDTILPMLGNADYLEYAMLRVAQKLGTGESSQLRPRVLVRTDMLISEDHVNFYKSQDEILRQQANEVGYPYGDSDFGNLLHFLSDMNRSLVPLRRESLRNDMLRTDPHLRNRVMAAYLDGELTARLSYWGISSVSEKELQKFGNSAIADAIRMTSALDATHLLQVTVREPQGSSDYHLSVKLYDETGRDVWVNEGERTIQYNPRLERYHCSSGRLAILKTKDSAVANAAENPPLVSYVRTRTPKQTRCELVYLESEDETRVQYRRLFDTQVREISRPDVEEVVSQIPSSFLTERKDTNDDLRFRFIAAKLAERLLPPVGRVTSTSESSGEVRGLTRDRGAVPGERCRVLRSVDGEKSLSVLPTDTNLGELGESDGHVTFHRSGFEAVNPNQVALKVGDLLLPRQWNTRSVLISSPRLVEVASGLAGRLRFSSDAGVREKYERNALRTSRGIANILSDSLVALGVPCAAPDINRPPAPGFQATHQITGTITLSPRMDVEGRGAASPRYFVTLKLTNLKTDEELEFIEFDYGDHIRESTIQN